MLLLSCAIVAVWRSPRLILPSLAVLWIVLGWTCAELRPQLVPSADVLTYADGLRRDVIGTVIDVEPLKPAPLKHNEDPLRWNEIRSDAEMNSTTATSGETADLQLTQVEQVTPDTSSMVPISGGLRLTLLSAPDLHCGDLIRVTTRLAPPHSYRDPGVWQYPEYLAQDGITATGFAATRDLHILQNSGAAPLPCRLAAMRHWATLRLDGFAQWQRSLRMPAALRWTSTDTGLLAAMVFGDRSQFQHSLRVQFERTGSFHLFVVAGMHVAFVAAGVYGLLTLLRVPRFAALLLGMVATTAYALVTGFGAPVQRALYMTIAYMLAQLLAREGSPLNALGLAALAMLAARPQSLFDSAFQMTVLVIVGLAGIAIPLLGRTLHPYLHACRGLRHLRLDHNAPPAIAQFRVALRFYGSLLADATATPFRHIPAALTWLLLAATELAILSVTAEMVMALPMAVYFHRVTPFALPANLLVVPAVPVLLAAAILTFVASLLSYWLALVPSLVVAALLRWTAAIIHGFGHLRSADWRIGNPPTLAAACALLCTAAAVFALRRHSRALAWVGIGLVPLTMLVALYPYAPTLHSGTLEVTAIDVGQGDSILLVASNGATMLIDAGGQVGAERTSRQATFDTGESVVSPYLWSRGLRRLDVMALTHAHMDHIGGMLATLQNFHPRQLWLSVDADSETLRELTTEATAIGTTVLHMHAGDNAPWPGGTMQVLSPEPDRTRNQDPVNDDSLVLRAEYGKASALLEGDAEQPSEDRMLSEHALRPVTLLKVGHHGSLTSTSGAFLAATHPVAAVISCGRGNHFGHPRFPILERLQAGHVQTARTDTMGATHTCSTRTAALRSTSPLQAPATPLHRRVPQAAWAYRQPDPQARLPALLLRRTQRSPHPIRGMRRSPVNTAKTPTGTTPSPALSADEQEERKLLRRLQMMMNLVQQTIAQDGSLTVDEASRMIADSREAALAMFPGKELAYDLLWKPRFQRLMIERFRLQ